MEDDFDALLKEEMDRIAKNVDTVVKTLEAAGYGPDKAGRGEPETPE